MDAQVLEAELTFLGATDQAVGVMKTMLAYPARQDSFIVTDKQWHGEDKIGVRVYIDAPSEGQAAIRGYEIRVRKGIDLPSGEVNGVNISDLETRMKAINWDVELPEGSYNIKDGSDAEAKEKDIVSKVQWELILLKANESPACRLVADRLMLKYWLDTPYEIFINDASEYKTAFDLWRYFKQEEPIFPTITQARSLMIGNPIGRSIVSRSEGISGYEWYILNTGHRDASGQFPIEQIGFFDAEAELSKLGLSVDDPDFERQIISNLAVGNFAPIEYMDGDKELAGNLKINPYRNTVEVWTIDGKFVRDSAAKSEKEIVSESKYSWAINGTTVRNKNYNESNLEYVEARLTDHGFPDSQHAYLAEEMKNGSSRIMLEFHSIEDQGHVRAFAEIKKMESGAYLPTNYIVQLKKPEWTYPRQQKFVFHNAKGQGKMLDIHWKTAVNLLAGGQALANWGDNKGNSVYEWRGLNFSTKSNEGYGFISFDSDALSVAKKLDELPIMEKDRTDLRHSFVVQSIQMGNSQSVHLLADGNPTVRLRANIPRRELDIIQGGRVLTLDELRASLKGYQEMIDIARNIGNGNEERTAQRTGIAEDGARMRKVLLNSGGGSGHVQSSKNQHRHGI
jgi:hypothetical protein